MATLFDSASLVMVPSGVKESKLYSIKPTNGDGDFTFSRGTDTATRVNASGLIEKERANFVLYSEQFDNAAWTKTDCSVTPNTTANPIDGALTADTIVFNGADDQITQTFNVTNHTFSVYIKGTAGETIVVGFGAGAQTIHTLTGGFDRVSVFGSSSFFVFIGTFDGATARTIQVYGAQLEQSLVATDYIATTSAPVYVGITDNLPRLDYSGGASCPSLLLEPSRTNLIAHSEYFGSWITDAAEVLTANSIQSPEGILNGYTLAQNNGAYQLNVYDRISITSGVDYVFSVWLKKKNTNQVQIYQYSINAPSGFVSRATIDFDAGTITDVDGSGATIEPYENGWFRCSVKCNAPSTLMQNGILTATIGVADVYAYGAQAEAGSYPTSYIPTYGTSASRAADSCSVTGVSDVIGQTEGTIFIEAEVDTIGDTTNLININHSTTAAVTLTQQSNKKLRFQVFGAAGNAFILDSAEPVSGMFKAAIVYKSGDSSLFVNGIESASSTATFTIGASGLNDIFLGTDIAYYAEVNQNKTKQVALFKTRLTNAELAALTTI